ncbi:MAG: hypothetical protein MZU97_18980 [Bacillus subtilis]|nr:hypothetical protein [Bacillus subtilis]
MDRNELDAVVQAYKGKVFSESLWMDLQASVYELDYFDEISPMALPGDTDYSTIIIKFTVTEKPWIESVRVDGAGASGREILDAALLKSGDIYNQTKARTDEKAIPAALRGKGIRRRVGVELHGTRPRELPRARLPGIRGEPGGHQGDPVRGEYLPGRGLPEIKLSLKEQGLFQPGLFQEQKLEADRIQIVDLYQSRGYVDAKIVDVLREINREEGTQKSRLILTFVISEGEQYNFGGLEYSGNRIFTTEKLSTLVRSKEGVILNYRTLLADKQRIEDLYYENGYIFNRIEMKERRDQDRRVIALHP